MTDPTMMFAIDEGTTQRSCPEALKSLVREVAET
jgi:hypothetical protein